MLRYIPKHNVNQMLPQIILILHVCLVDSLLYYPDFVLNWIEVTAV